MVTFGDAPPRLRRRPTIAERQTEEEERQSRSGWRRTIATRRHPVDSVDGDTGERREYWSSVAGREARGPQVEVAFGAVLVSHRRAFVEHARRRVERLAVLEVTHCERCMERGDRDGAAGTHGVNDALNTSGSSRPPSSPKPPWQRHTAASNSPSNASVPTSATSKRAKGAPGPPPHARARVRVVGQVDAEHVDTASGERQGVTPGTAADVEHAGRPGASPRASQRKSTSCSVPFVNAFRR